MIKNNSILKRTKIRYIDNLLKEDIREPRKESKKEGYNIIERLINEFRNGKNKFNKKGEALIVCQLSKKIIGICGLNIDPLSPKRAKIRRLYALMQYRKICII